MLGTRRTALLAALAWALSPFAGLGEAPGDAATPPGPVVPVKLDQQLSSSSVKDGDRFTFTTTKTVRIGEIDVPSGTEGHGVVAKSRAAKWDKGGDLELEVVSLDLADGRTIPVSAARGPRAESHSMIADAVKTAESDLKPNESVPAMLVPLDLPVKGIVLLGSALHILKGHNVTFPAGATFAVTPTAMAEGSDQP
jgi:hypothetical protein